MGRGKLEIKLIENPLTRRATFNRRRMDLFKKSKELATLCNADIALVIFSCTGKLHEYASSSMKSVLERYNGCLERTQNQHHEIEQLQHQLEQLQHRIEQLQLREKHMLGEQLSDLSMKDLQQLECQLESAINQMRSRKLGEHKNQCPTPFLELQPLQIKDSPNKRDVDRPFLANNSCIKESETCDTSLHLGLFGYTQRRSSSDEAPKGK